MQANVLCPKVSVVMPCYNNAAYVRQAVDSVLQQDYPNIELIVVDDGSTDNSLEVLASYGDRIRVIVQPNQGPAAARNNGIRHATGDYIAFLDSDDLWLPGKLSAQLEFLQTNPDFIACFCSWSVWDGNEIPAFNQPTAEQRLELQKDKSGWLYLPLLDDSVIHTISVVIKKQIMDSVGFFNEDYRVGEDHDYWLRLSRVGKIAKLKTLYALYRANQQSTTNKVHAKNFSLLVLQAAVDNYGLCDPEGKCLPESVYQQYVARRHFMYGYQSFWAGHKDKALVAFRACLPHSTYRLKSFIYLTICQFDFIYHFVISRRA
ncbi:MAG TPA: glycosyl transferase family 2 [Rheinheimera sp.]|uniref:glycosyltransferase family 2 protein n=1 Tax=Rheinheimera sp. TaxID=1869214 RepID=UPI000EE77EDF|nr:glycosyltransferase [Rheinheimera sp.]HCU65321.1 glycosyl transferase family 2 [Rheinheimera sp.]